MHKGFRCWLALGVGIALAAAAGEAFAFSPARQFPDTSDGIYVFVDQLSSGLTTAQRQFAATHYVGTQKQTSMLIGAIRAYNPDFLHIQYRLGVRESNTLFIHRNNWLTDFNYVWQQDDWFVYDYDVPYERVYQDYSGIEEYCMDISGEINGNTTNGWKEYWASEVVIDANLSAADGVFADSTHLPYNVPSFLHDSPIGSPPHTPYIYHLEKFYDYVYPELDAANVYFIPNIGALTTTLDTTQGYYEDVHGAMVEGYATRLSNYDWKLQQNRVLQLLGNDKIYIAQSGFADHTRINDRLWYLSNYLLMKHDKSYVNMFSNADTQLYWWPEYDLDLGTQVDPSVPTNIDQLKSASGVYYREYEKALVLVNPNSTPKSFTLDDQIDYKLVQPWGGGAIGAGGTPVRDGGLTLTDAGASVMVQPWSGAILTFQPIIEPTLEHEFRYLGDGVYGVTFTVCGNDGELEEIAVNLSFEGANGGQIQQMKAILDPGVEEYDVDTEADAATYDGEGTPPYDEDRDSYFLEPFTLSGSFAASESENYYQVVSDTGGVGYEEAALAYIVCTGDVTFSGLLGRGGEIFTPSGLVEMPLPGDADLNGQVDGADYTTWADNYQQTDKGWSGADFNGDGVVDGGDYTIWADHFTGGGAAVPEPASLVLTGWAGLALLGRRRRRA